MPPNSPEIKEYKDPSPSVLNDYRDWFVLSAAIFSAVAWTTFSIIGAHEGDFSAGEEGDLLTVLSTGNAISSTIAGFSYAGIGLGAPLGKSVWMRKRFARLFNKKNKDLSVETFTDRNFFERLRNAEDGIEQAATFLGVLTGIAIATTMLVKYTAETLKSLPIPMISELAAIWILFDQIGSFGGVFGRISRIPSRIKNNLKKGYKGFDRTYEIAILIGLISGIILLTVFNLHHPLGFLNFQNIIEMMAIVGRIMGGTGYLAQNIDFLLDLDHCDRRRSFSTVFKKEWHFKNLNWTHQNRATMVGVGISAIGSAVSLHFMLHALIWHTVSQLALKLIAVFLMTRFLPPIVGEIIFVLFMLNAVVGAARRIGRAIDAAQKKKKMLEEAAQQQAPGNPLILPENNAEPPPQMQQINAVQKTHVEPILNLVQTKNSLNKDENTNAVSITKTNSTFFNGIKKTIPNDFSSEINCKTAESKVLFFKHSKESEKNSSTFSPSQPDEIQVTRYAIAAA